MMLRSLATALCLAIVSGLAAEATAQEKAKAPDSKAKTKKGDTKKSEDTKKANDAKPVKTELATFGGGCFWCQEAVFERVPGVKSVISGYAGGNVPNPSYDMVCTGETGHAEVVQIEYDPEVVTFDTLLDVFWHCHDPTTPNAQGPDFGTQYRSIILYHNDAQKQAALKAYEALTKARAFRSPIVTQLVALDQFYPAEPYHQDYYRRHNNEAYCKVNVVPKLKKLEKMKLK